jgi:hypothetical protein
MVVLAAWRLAGFGPPVQAPTLKTPAENEAIRFDACAQAATPHWVLEAMVWRAQTRDRNDAVSILRFTVRWSPMRGGLPLLIMRRMQPRPLA